MDIIFDSYRVDRVWQRSVNPDMSDMIVVTFWLGRLVQIEWIMGLHEEMLHIHQQVPV